MSDRRSAAIANFGCYLVLGCQQAFAKGGKRCQFILTSPPLQLNRCFALDKISCINIVLYIRLIHNIAFRKGMYEGVESAKNELYVAKYHNYLSKSTQTQALLVVKCFLSIMLSFCD